MAEDRLGQFRPACADQPCEADNFARTDVETDIVDSLCGQALHRKGDLAAAARSAFIEVRYRPSDHSLNDFSFRKLERWPLVDEPPVAQHGDAIRQIPDLP